MCFLANIKLTGVSYSNQGAVFPCQTCSLQWARGSPQHSLTFTTKMATPFQTSDVENWKMKTLKKYLNASGVLFSGYNEAELVWNSTKFVIFSTCDKVAACRKCRLVKLWRLLSLPKEIFFKYCQVYLNIIASFKHARHEYFIYLLSNIPLQITGVHCAGHIG